MSARLRGGGQGGSSFHTGPSLEGSSSQRDPSQEDYFWANLKFLIVMILAREVSRPKLKKIFTRDLTPTSRGTLRQEFRSHKAPQVEVPVGDKIETPKCLAV